MQICDSCLHTVLSWQSFLSMIANEINYFLFKYMTGRHILIGFFTFRLRSQQLMGILIYIFFPFSSNLLFDCLLTFTHLFIYLHPYSKSRRKCHLWTLHYLAYYETVGIFPLNGGQKRPVKITSTLFNRFGSPVPGVLNFSPVLELKSRNGVYWFLTDEGNMWTFL